MMENLLNSLLLVAVIGIGFIATLLLIQFIRFRQGLKQLSVGAAVKDVRVIKYDTKAVAAGMAKNDLNEMSATEKMNHHLFNETTFNGEMPLSNNGAVKDGERRGYPRKEFVSSVEFIKKGVLFKEMSKDLSYSGMFVRSNKPERYSIGDLLLVTFQTAKGRPQKYRGQIVRKETAGIGIRFLRESANPKTVL